MRTRSHGNQRFRDENTYAASVVVASSSAKHRSVIGLLSNSFLCLGKAYGFRTVSKQCMDQRLAISLFEVAPVSMNTVEDRKKARLRVLFLDVKSCTACRSGLISLTAVVCAVRSTRRECT